MRHQLSQVTGIPLLLMLLVACATPVSAPPIIAPTATLVPPTPSPEPPKDTLATTLNTEVTRRIVYANVDELQTELDVYAPSGPGPWPVVIVVHGAAQTRSNFRELSQAVASQGAVVYNIDASFSVPFITGIQRVACAVRFARATAADYGGDPSRITLFGNSAGAGTGAVVALAGNDFERGCVVAVGSALPDALVAFEGGYDNEESANWGEYDHTFLKEEDPELWHIINPYSYIGRNPNLQVRLVHGNDEDRHWYDEPLESSNQFHQALADAGYEVELIVLEGASHTALSRGHLFPDAFALTVQQVMELARGSSQ